MTLSESEKAHLQLVALRIRKKEIEEKIKELESKCDDDGSDFDRDLFSR